MKKRTQPDPIDEALRREPEYQEIVKLLKCQEPERLNKLEKWISQDDDIGTSEVESDD